VQLNPAQVRPSKWACRHESAYASAAFERFKDNIDLAEGNGQPILVRQVDDGYEIICGNRRHRACRELGLPVFAVVWDEPLSDLELFLAMERENRERADLSPYDQGRMYFHALDSGLFSSQRRLAVAIGVSHTWIRKVIQIARLPVEVIEAFLDPATIQPVHAEDIAVALALDAVAVIGRAIELAATRRTSKRSATQVVDRLVGRETPQEATFLIRCGSKTVGHWRRDGKGRAVVTLDVGVSNEAAMARVVAAIERAGWSGNIVSSRPQLVTVVHRQGKSVRGPAGSLRCGLGHRRASRGLRSGDSSREQADSTSQPQGSVQTTVRTPLASDAPVACAFRTCIASAPIIPIRACHRLRAASSPNVPDPRDVGGPGCRGGSSLRGFRWRVSLGDRTHELVGGLGSSSDSGPVPCRWHRYRISHRAHASGPSCFTMKPLAAAAGESPDDAALHLDFAGSSL
jgi:ParB family chromosome partitioning protein